MEEMGSEECLDETLNVDPMTVLATHSSVRGSHADRLKLASFIRFTCIAKEKAELTCPPQYAYGRTAAEIVHGM